MANGRRYLIYNLFDCNNGSYNFENIFKINLMMESTNENLIKALETIPGTKQEEDYDENEDVDDDNDDECNNNTIINNIKFRLDNKINSEVETKRK